MQSPVILGNICAGEHPVADYHEWCITLHLNIKAHFGLLKFFFKLFSFFSFDSPSHANSAGILVHVLHCKYLFCSAFIYEYSWSQLQQRVSAQSEHFRSLNFFYILKWSEIRLKFWRICNELTLKFKQHDECPTEQSRFDAHFTHAFSVSAVFFSVFKTLFN